MNITLKQLEAFVWVCDLGSFRKAAERLNTTQPNISTRILALEDYLGTRLMERNAGAVRLTQKGRDLLLQARSVLRAAETFVEVAGKASVAEGVLKLGVTELIVNTWLRDFLREAKHKFPNVTIELTVDLSVRISEGLHNQTFDLTLQSSPFSQGVDKTLNLGTYPYVWVMAPHVQKQLPDTRLASLSAFPILTHARGTLAVDEIENHFNANKGKSARIVPSSNMSACLHMAIDGLGIAVLPEAMARADIEAGRLVVVKHAWHPKPLKMCARYNATHVAAYVPKIALIAKKAATQFEAEQQLLNKEN